MTIQEKLDELAGSATSKSDKGAKLEKQARFARVMGRNSEEHYRPQ